MKFRWPWQKKSPAEEEGPDAGIYIEYFQDKGLRLSVYPALRDEEIIAFLDSALLIIEEEGYSEPEVERQAKTKGHLTLVKG